MRWTVKSEEQLYRDRWLDIRLAEVDAGGRTLDHRLIRTPPGAGVVVIDEQRHALLLWRHRFITDTWGWEIPIGQVEDGESAAVAAARECEEETGWRPSDPLRPLLVVHPTPGISDSAHHVFQADGATYTGPPTDGWESERIEWVPLADVPGLIEQCEITSGTTATALLYALSTTQ
ncbi:NUDIX hydrolase [Actinomadura logoneensis]|uniref:NUDIX hydrolase n=1 Tax=Actinomadura logoneensis TaxID=2293572 RepID=A0A372JPJ4_9ACTN|nr:NUDIX hydrolase [Actinomadura logoneensis]RFU41943.1 NUDIX hydrolase [Actinomadura logoneensis]